MSTKIKSKIGIQDIIEVIRNEYEYDRIIENVDKSNEFISALVEDLNDQNDELVSTMVVLVNIATRLRYYHLDIDVIMKLMNNLLNGFGVEALKDENAYTNHYYQDTIALYVNRGDVYHETILFDIDSDEFMNISMGCWYEDSEQYKESLRIEDEQEREREDVN